VERQFEFTVYPNLPPTVAVINNETQQMERMMAAEENDLAPDGYYFKKIPVHHRWDYVNKKVVPDPRFVQRITMETI
jgi:hypothetical protein